MWQEGKGTNPQKNRKTRGKNKPANSKPTHPKPQKPRRPAPPVKTTVKRRWIFFLNPTTSGKGLFLCDYSGATIPHTPIFANPLGACEGANPPGSWASVGSGLPLVFPNLPLWCDAAGGHADFEPKRWVLAEGLVLVGAGIMLVCGLCLLFPLRWFYAMQLAGTAILFPHGGCLRWGWCLLLAGTATLFPHGGFAMVRVGRIT